MADQRASFRDLLLAALFGGAVASAVVGLMLARHQDALSQRAWKEQSVAELLGPVDAQLRHTRRAFERGDRETLEAGNEAVRDLLLTRSHLVPPELRPDADALVEHYDQWLATYEQQRREDGPVGPIDIAFPTEAGRRFSDTYRRYMSELYGQ